MGGLNGGPIGGGIMFGPIETAVGGLEAGLAKPGGGIGGPTGGAVLCSDAAVMGGLVGMGKPVGEPIGDPPGMEPGGIIIAQLRLRALPSCPDTWTRLTLAQRRGETPGL